MSLWAHSRPLRCRPETWRERSTLGRCALVGPALLGIFTVPQPLPRGAKKEQLCGWLGHGGVGKGCHGSDAEPLHFLTCSHSLPTSWRFMNRKRRVCRSPPWPCCMPYTPGQGWGSGYKAWHCLRWDSLPSLPAGTTLEIRAAAARRAPVPTFCGQALLWVPRVNPAAQSP